MEKAQEILDFWLDEVGPEGWYIADDALDQKIRDRFLGDWELAAKGKYCDWRTYPDKALALIILLDQFPRNMFRNDKQAFSTDKLARCAARHAIDAKFDLRTPEPARQFYYLPLMHSECLTDQERCVRLVTTRMPETSVITLPHARAHRELIRKYGRFPFRNQALERKSTAAEAEFLGTKGYQQTLQDILAA
ncbi:MAG: DUF924 domain-containing protein [Rhodobacteraceae bacterium]|nr:DUF924 domain-containing protein [Paracoccaceae bacterium]